MKAQPAEVEPAEERLDIPAARTLIIYRRGNRSPQRASALLVVLLAGATLVVLSTDSMRLGGELPGIRLLIETLGTVAAALGSALSFMRYAINSSRRWLYVAMALLVLSVNQTAFGIVASGASSLSPQQKVYFWAAGRLVAMALLLAGTRRTSTWISTERTSTRWVRLAATAAACVGAAQALLWVFRDRLPTLTSAQTSAQVARYHGALPGLTIADIVLGALGTAAYLFVAYRFLQPDANGDGPPPWLPPALVVAAFASLHYLFFPSIFRDRLSTGDLFRLAFFVVLLAGLIDELRAAYLAERQRAEELERAYARELARTEEMEQMDRQTAELFSIMTHELAQPAAALRGAVVALSKYRGSMTDERIDHLVEQMYGESVRIRDLTEEVITVSHLDSEGFTLFIRPEPVVELLREAAGAIGSSRPLKVVVAPEVESSIVSADRARVFQVFRNLLSNADKYSPGGGRVEMKAEPAHDAVVFSVADRGPGITSQDAGRLFKRFSRLHREQDKDVPGSGLGLYIARRIVEAHGGHIWLDSQPGEGAVFSFTLPMSPREPARTTEAERPHAARSTKTDPEWPTSHLPESFEGVAKPAVTWSNNSPQRGLESPGRDLPEHKESGGVPT